MPPCSFWPVATEAYDRWWFRRLRPWFLSSFLLRLLWPYRLTFQILFRLYHLVPPSLFEQAELAFASGNYPEAIQTYEALSVAEQSDQALFHLGIAYILNDKGTANWGRAKANLERLVEEYPESSLTPTAGLILSLRSRVDHLAKDTKTRDDAIQQLRSELERLKRIDADRRKRP